MNGGEQYSLDMALLKVREEKRKRKMRSERAVILFVVWILVFRVCGIMRVDGNSMRPACHPGDIVFFLRILPDGVDYGDAVILKDASGEYLIKRIAGLPGDVMEVDREGHKERCKSAGDGCHLRPVGNRRQRGLSVHRAGRELFLPRGQPPGVFRQQDARCGRKGRDKRKGHLGSGGWEMEQKNR